MATLTRNIQAKVREVERVWFDRTEAARYACVSVSKIKEWNYSGRLGFYKPDGVVLIKKSELDRFIEKSKVI
jgi:excisionase family DNA binding protein